MKKTILFLILFTFTFPVFAQDFNDVKYLRNYDGDTINFDLGSNLPDIFRFIPIRLLGIDTPEIKSKNPIAFTAKDFVHNSLASASRIDLKNCKLDKYSRLDCSVVYDGKDLTTEELNRGYGYEYWGGTKRK